MSNFERIQTSAILLLGALTVSPALAVDEDGLYDHIGDLRRYTFAGTENLNSGLQNEGRKCLPNWEEHYSPTVRSDATLMADAAKQALDASDDEHAFLPLNRPFLGVLRSGQKSTKYMCKRGYESLVSEYDFRVKHYQDALDVLDEQQSRLNQAAAEYEKLFDKKLVQKDFSAGKCIFSAGVLGTAKDFNYSLTQEAKIIDAIAGYYRGRLVEERQDRKDAVNERSETCDGKSVKPGVKENPGYDGEQETSGAKHETAI